MGLKIRRLKSGFAYYAEYKFGRHCIYEKIEASSAREAKRMYNVRLRELRHSLPERLRSSTQTEAKNDRVTATLSAMLRKLIDKQVISEEEALELLPEFSSIAPLDSSAADRDELAPSRH